MTAISRRRLDSPKLVVPLCDDDVMSPTATSFATGLSPKERLEVLFEELSELTGQRNAIDGRIVDIVAEIDRGNLAGITGARSVPALIAWKTGTAPRNAETIATVAHRLAEFPRCAEGLRAGRYSLDQIGVIAERAADGSDEHYAQLAESATVSQLRTAIKLEPRPEPDPRPEPQRSITKTDGEQFTTWRITLPHDEAATFDAALDAHRDALITDWKNDHTGHADGGCEQAPPFPNTVDGFMRLIEAGWDAEATRRPHGQRTTVVVHLDLESRIAALHLGPLLTDDERRYLTCDATCEVWFERHGQVVGCGRATRPWVAGFVAPSNTATAAVWSPAAAPPAGCTPTTSATGRTAAPPNCSTSYWCARITTGCTIEVSSPSPDPPSDLVVTDSAGQPLSAGSLARPPAEPPPAVAPYRGPTGERAQWWWYQPFQPHPPPTVD